MCTAAAVSFKTQLAREFCVSPTTLNGLPSFEVEYPSRRHVLLLRHMAFERAVAKHGSEGALRNKMRSKMDDMELPFRRVPFMGFRDSSVSVRFPIQPSNHDLVRLAPLLFPLERGMCLCVLTHHVSHRRALGAAAPPSGVAPFTDLTAARVHIGTSIVLLVREWRCHYQPV
eukprot:TRINITY_DN6192_c0_g2_i1.p1 TRINITY_DN6192_c0_g2~~TRINITY_DN6192_c0_g2_i1.p1  ORF type:complete len:172 (-),score=23.76 TRINITY_DN6192_c0_g2_i1:11-526(-)